jgi:ribosomal protein S18 acetylase RimI-like enzyme
MRASASSAVITPFLLERDTKAILGLEQELYSQPWTRDALDHYAKPNSGGFVAMQDDQLVGYLFYTIQSGVIEITNLAVAEAYRRQGVATLLVNQVKAKAQKIGNGFAGNAKLKCLVRESSLVIQLFLKANFFWASRVVPMHFEDTHEDAYRMDYPKVEATTPSLATTKKSVGKKKR